MQSSRVSLDEVFSPRGVAVVGASGPGKMSFASLVLHGLIEAEFPAIYPVNPKYDEVGGLRCYPDLVSIPGVVDHVVVSIPAESAMALLDECAAKGVKSVHFFTAGFGESGFEARAELEQQMLERARTGGFRIIGPNCVGLFVPKSRVMNVPGAPLDPGPIAFISQSGGHAQEPALFALSSEDYEVVRTPASTSQGTVHLAYDFRRAPENGHPLQGGIDCRTETYRITVGRDER